MQVKRPSIDVLFTWSKPESGHEWKQKGRWRGARYLVPRLGAKGKVTEYAPHPGLFRTFASLNSAKDDARAWEIKVFANAYGDIIARPQDDHVRLTTEVEMVRTHATMETWCRAIQHMRRGVELWDWINDTGKHEDLKRLFTRPKGAILYWQKHHPLERKSDNTTCPALAMNKDVAKYPVGEIVPLARKALHVEIQEALTDIETPSHATACLVLPEMQMVLRPVNLLAYMWLCFARVVSGEIEERRCEMFARCGEYIYVGTGSGLQRSDATTCSAACRQEKKRAAQKAR
jgi:hypothetical protein